MSTTQFCVGFARVAIVEYADQLFQSSKLTIPPFLLTFVVYLVNVVAGIHYSWTSANLSIFLSEPFSFTNDTISTIASALHLGRWIGPFVILLITYRFGRKTHITAAALMILLGQATLITWKSVPAILGARFIIGLNLGICDSSYIIYAGEILSQQTRGRLCSVVSVSFHIGTTLAFLFGNYCAYDDTSLIMLAFTILGVLSTVLLVETPQFLLIHGDAEKALQNLAWLRSRSLKQAEPELAEMCTATEKNVKFSELRANYKKPEIYKSYCIVSSLGIITSLIGTTISSYANVILPTSELISSNQFAASFSLLTMLATCVSSWLVDRCGRRALLIPCFSLVALAFACLAALFYLQDHSWQIPYFPWVVFTSLTITYLGFQMGASLPSSVLRSEIFPSNFKTIGVNTNIILNAFTNFTASLLFLQIVDCCGIYLNFLIFSAVSFAAMAVVYCWLPETKGKTLIQIQMTLKK